MIRIFLMMLMFSSILFAQNIDTYRNNYMRSVEDKSICKNMIDELTKHQKKPIFKAYLGAYQTIWANHAVNPISKLNTFNKGKSNIEDAIKLDPKNIEIRFLRYSIQVKAPKFLGYHKQIETDRLFILSNKRLIKEESLNQLIKYVE